ncbi:MAG: tetratricopeptide repeat protein [Elusimicrobiota bacterium]
MEIRNQDSLKSPIGEFLRKFIIYALPLFSFLLAIAFYLRTYDSCQVKISLVQVGVPVLFSLWLISRIENNNLLESVRGYEKTLLPVLLFLISGIVSYMISPFKDTSLEELLRRLLYILTFTIIISEFTNKDQIELFLRWIILAAFVSSLYGIIQWFGLDPFLWKGAFGNRIFSTFGNPNFFSAFLVWVCPILLTYMLLTKKYSYGVLFIICALNVMQSQSKASWIGLTAGIIMFAFLTIRYLSHANKKNIKKLLIMFVIGTIIIASLGVFYFITKRVNSVRFRVFTWMSTWEMIRHPEFVTPLQSNILGTGIGTFKIVYPSYRMPEIFHIEGKHNTETDHPENEFIEIWYDEGIIGFGIFLWMLLVFYWTAIYKTSYLSKSLQALFRKDMTTLQKKQLSLQHYLVGVTAGLTGLLVHNLMCVNMRFVSSGFFFWVLLGLIIAIIRSIQRLHVEEVKENAKYQFNWKKLISIIIILGVCVYACIYFARFFIADYHHNRGIAYSKAKIWNRAIDEYNEVIKNNPGYIMTHYFLGNVFNDRWNMEPVYNPLWDGNTKIPRTDAERALAKYDDVKRLAPNYVQVHYQTGVIYMKLGEWENAIECFKKYHKLDPVFPQNYFQMAWAYNKLGMYKEAEETFKEAINQNPIFVEAYINLGNTYYMQKRIKDAEEMYKKAIEINPKEAVNAYRNLIVIYSELNNLKAAYETAQALLQMDPNNEYAKSIIQKIQSIAQKSK